MSISATYAHPIEHALTNVLPIIISVKLTGMNFVTTRLWHSIILINALIVAHGGYKIPNYDPMHDLHHVYNNCNFGVFGLCDQFYGTKRTFSKEEKEALYY